MRVGISSDKDSFRRAVVQAKVMDGGRTGWLLYVNGYGIAASGVKFTALGGVASEPVIASSR
ncbi:hypothetical protein [Nonomuraea jiangxiensis]|nr:hypothetical protein [Nonomuraea jiangxiensis]